MLKSKLFRRKLRPVATNCPFCRQKISPDFKEVNVLKTYISERGRIIGKDRTGLCSRHQRQVSVEIKRARFLALLPFTTQVR